MIEIVLNLVYFLIKRLNYFEILNEDYKKAYNLTIK
jgi:hypothetical protein